MYHTTRVVLVQTDVDDTTNEITQFQPQSQPAHPPPPARKPPWRNISVLDETRDRGRVEIRRLQVAIVAGLDFPMPPRPSVSPGESGTCAAAAGAP